MDLLNDDYDPLAPMHVESPDEVGDASRGGFSDPDQIVRVWIEDHQLTRVRLAVGWRERLGDRDLARCFEAAFALYRLQPPSVDDIDEAPDPLDDDFSDVPRFTGDVLTTFAVAFENFERRWIQAAERLSQQPLEVAQVASGEAEGVEIRLNQRGELESIYFEEDWLEEADSREVSDSVIAAAKAARANYQPPSDPVHELTQLATEHRILVTGLVHSLAGKKPR